VLGLAGLVRALLVAAARGKAQYGAGSRETVIKKWSAFRGNLE